MIDVMKRLAELDSQNPNVVNENKMAELDDDLKTMSAEEFKAKYKKTKAEARAAMKPDAVKESLAECGMSPMPGMSGMSSSPANISITAGSGPELSGMLKDIMSLAGIQRAEPAAMSMTAEPEIEIEPAEPEDGMRSMIDKMNEPDGEEEFGGDEEGEEEFGDEEDDEKAEEGMYDNSPDIDIEGPNAFANHGNQEMGGPPGAAKGRGLTTGPRAHTSEDIESQLFAEYAKFVTEAAPSAGMSKQAKSAVVKKDKAGKDIGKSAKTDLKKKVKEGFSHAADPFSPFNPLNIIRTAGVLGDTQQMIGVGTAIASGIASVATLIGINAVGLVGKVKNMFRAPRHVDLADISECQTQIRQLYKKVQTLKTEKGREAATEQLKTAYQVLDELKAKLSSGVKAGAGTLESVAEGLGPNTQSHADAFKSETDTMKPNTKKYVGRKGDKEVHAKKDAQGNVKFYHRDGIKGPLNGVAEDAEPGYVKYEQMKDKIAGVLIKLYNQGKDPETIKQMGDRVAQHLGYDTADSVFQDAWMSSFTDASLDGSLDQDSEDDYTDRSMRRGEMGRESMQNEAGWDKDKQDFKRREMDVEMGHERNNYEVVINGRGWKVFADKRQADNIARVLRSKGKDATVQITGANPTA